MKEKQSKKLHEELIKSERFDMFVTNDIYTVKKRLFSCENSVRILINENIPIYAYADAWDAVHLDMAELLVENGYLVSRFYEEGRIDLICVPNKDEEFDIEADAVADDYFEAYEYDDFTIYSRQKDDNCGIAFTDTSLYKVLGEPNHIWDLSEYYDDELNESGNYSNIYHATSLSNALNIIKENILRVSGNNWYNVINGNCVCFSRDFNVANSIFSKKYVIFVVDKNKLSNSYKLLPVSDDKNSINIIHARSQHASKAEEVCMRDITNFKKYITKIIISDDCYNEFVNSVDIHIPMVKLSEYKKKVESLDESLLLEATRNELIMKSKKGDPYRDQSKGKNRFERRTKSKISRYVKQYNDIDMNNFFKNDILTVGIDVNGETNNYVVKMKFSGVLKAIQDMIKANNNTLDFRTIFVSLANTFKSGDVYMHCTCPDWKYRFDYWSTVNKYNAGQPQNDPGKGIANPRDSKGGGCKHSLLVLNNLDWLMKIASVINNYIHYAEHNMKRPFENLIFPKLYGVPFNQATKADIIPDEELDSSKSIIDIINEYGKTRTRYKKQPEKSVNPRFHQNKKEIKVED